MFRIGARRFAPPLWRRREVTRVERRGFAYFRQVKFPPTERFPLVWFCYSLVMINELGNHSARILELKDKMKTWFRQAQSEVWGADRVVRALDSIRGELVVNHGSSFDGFLNAAPRLLNENLVTDILLPNLQSDQTDVVEQSAEVLGELLLQKKIAKRLCEDEVVVTEVVNALKRWYKVDCLECGNPSPALGSLISVMASIGSACKTEKSKRILEGKVDVLMPILEAISEKVEKASQANRKRGVRDGRGIVYTITSTDVHDKWKHGQRWFVNVGLSCNDLAGTLTSHFASTRMDMIPIFCRLTRALWPTDLASMDIGDRESDDDIPPTYDLGMSLFETLDKQKQVVKPKNISNKDWSYLNRVRPFFEEIESSLSVRIVRFLDRHEAQVWPIVSVITAAASGFLWGSLRTFLALRGVTDPSTLTGFANGNNTPPQPPTYNGFSGHIQPGGYAAQPPPTQQPQHMNARYGVPQNQMPPPPRYQQAPLPHSPSQFPSSTKAAVPRGWKGMLISKHGKLAAVGCCVLIVWHDVLRFVSDYVWIEDEKRQVVLALTTTLADISLMLGTLRLAPYSFVPTIFTLSYTESFFSDHIFVETEVTSTD